ncbi:MAG: hypothetical protein P8Y99_01675 [Calditrichaceae bacterium]
MNINAYDAEAIYCRKLGHHLKFDYCRRESDELPCSRIAKCWAERIPIDDFLRSHFSDDDLDKIFAPPVPKITSLIELIQKAQALKE